MTIHQRIKKVINWLIFNEFAENETEIAMKLGYKKSSLSQIINGKVPLSNRFIDKLCDADKNINKIWITAGTGEMFKTTILNVDVHFLTEKICELGKEIGKLKAENDALNTKIRYLESISANKRTVDLDNDTEQTEVAG
ncbi:MAG: XRE family transcriptional regulator [Prevotellaceae bacterium]|jgi:transcriptional regulator with XRE-family HTH domain|nr:XRE family transcriptional regulator [Prevotellaceae bacterium]